MQDKSNLRKIYEAIRGGIGSPMSGLGPTQEYMRDILKPEGFDERQAQTDMSIRKMFEIEFKRARERGDEVFEFMGKPYNTKTKEEVQGFSSGDSVYGPKALVPGGGIPSMVIDTPNISTGQDIDFSDVFDKDAQDEAEEDLNNFNNTEEKEEEEEEEEDKKEKSDIEKIGEMLSLVAEANKFTPLVGGQIVKGSQASIPQLQRFQYGGIANFQYGGPAGMYNIDQDYIRRYYEDILGMNIDDLGEEDSEEAMANALARAYGAPSEGIGSYARSMGYRDTTPGAPISIDAQDKTPDAYRFYPSEVSKIYAQAKGVPFSPLVAPPKEATFIDDMQPRRIASQLYAKDGTYVQGYADGTGEMGVEDFPERDQLVTGPGGERGDKIPAMLSDGEFVTNSAAVRGIGLAAGADPNDEYEQRLLGAREMYKMQKFGEEIAKKLV